MPWIIEGLEESGWDGHGAADAVAALLDALEDEDARGRIDAIGGKGKGVREPATSVSQRD